MKQKKNILALILLLYPLRHCITGLDLMDAGYALGNYRFYDNMNETWKLATYLANVMGVLLSRLPFGNTWIGMNVYTGLLIGLTASGTYLFMVNHRPKDDKKEILLFIAELGALSLCWAPSTILYHYLGYILMTVAILLLYTAITKDNMRYYIIAGIILGLCVAVRMPNITYMAFILPLWYYQYARRGEDKKWFWGLAGRTLYCIGGYLIGLIVPIAYIEARYGVYSYPNMVASLFGMTDTATDYKPTSMITAMFEDYINYSVWLFVFLSYIVIGVVFFKALKKIMSAKVKDGMKDKITNVFKTAYCIGYLVVLRFCYGRGMFGVDFAEYFSVYKWVTVYLLCVVLLCIWTLLGKKSDGSLKLWSVFVLVIIFITPLGSNNGLYPIINNLFVVAPISILLVDEFYKKALDTLKGNTPFVIKTIITYVMICIFVSSLLFGIDYIFHDYTTIGSKRESISLKCGSAANGLLTTTDKKESLEALDGFLYDNGLNGKSLITYGDIPALSYILDMQPAIYTTWMDLDSNSLSSIEKQLEGLSGLQINSMPIIIIGKEAVDSYTDEQKFEYKKRKLKMLENFINNNSYVNIYENKNYMVYEAYDINYLSK